jgi:hypothetical protein
MRSRMSHTITASEVHGWALQWLLQAMVGLAYAGWRGRAWGFPRRRRGSTLRCNKKMPTMKLSTG